MKKKSKPKFKFGKKFDEGKPDYLIIFKYLDFQFLQECARVMEIGEKKYGFENWKKNLKEQKIKKALLRHIKQYLTEKRIDKESKRTHLAHIFCNIMFLFYYDVKKGLYVPKN